MQPIVQTPPPHTQQHGVGRRRRQCLPRSRLWPRDPNALPGVLMRAFRPYPLSTLAPAALLLAACVASPLAQAASSAASSASDSVSTSVGSSSTSIQKSSDGSSRATGVAAGDYRVIDVAQAADRPGQLRVRLQALADDSADGALVLTLPQQAVAQAPLAQGQVVSALQRPYGVAFARQGTEFFLVLHDDWFRELGTRPVTL
jgi:hypothetical protein